MSASPISRREFEVHFADLLSVDGSKRLRSGEAESVERAITYLEATPNHSGSGYACAALIHRLKWLSFSATQRVRLCAVILQAVDSRDRQEFRSFCRLAANVRTPELVSQLDQCKQSPNPDVQRRAGWMIDYLAQFDRSNHTA